MNQLRKHINQSKIRFSRWSRKNWAVFNSLGREVLIGHIDVPVAGQALRKTELRRNGLVIDSKTIQITDTDNEEDISSGIASMAELTLLLLSPFIALELPSPAGESSLHNIPVRDWPLADCSVTCSAPIREWKEILLPLIR